MRTESEFRALLVLLSDEEDRVASVAWQTLLGEREAAVPYLEEAANSADTRLRGRARLLLEELRVAAIEDEWQQFAATPDDDMDLERGCLLLSRLVGEVDARAVGSFLDAIAGMVRAHMVNVGGMQALREVLFDNLGFRAGDFDQPGCHYLSTVLERRQGIPISLVAVYVLVGQRAGLPVSGVAMPGHFLARYEQPGEPLFVDCFHRGRVYRQEMLSDLLSSRGINAADRVLSPCGHRFTLFRMMNNLESLYTQQDDLRMAGVIERFREHLGLEQ